MLLRLLLAYFVEKLGNSETKKLLGIFREPDAQSRVTFSASERRLSEFSRVSDYPPHI